MRNGIKTHYIRYGTSKRVHKLMVEDATGNNFSNGRCHLASIAAPVTESGIFPENMDVATGYIRGWLYDGLTPCLTCFKKEIEAVEGTNAQE